MADQSSIKMVGKVCRHYPTAPIVTDIEERLKECESVERRLDLCQCLGFDVSLLSARTSFVKGTYYLALERHFAAGAEFNKATERIEQLARKNPQDEQVLALVCEIRDYINRNLGR